MGNYMRDTLICELKDHHFFRDVRGRGMRFSLEYKTENNSHFSSQIADNMLKKHNILINAKWHRICFTPSLLLKSDEVDLILEKTISEFKEIAGEKSAKK